MKKYFFILFFLPFSIISQNRDYVIFDGKKYKGKLLQYFNKDISFENSGHLLFFDNKRQDLNCFLSVISIPREQR